jgi:fructose-bisphosphate aldolase, class II
VAQAERAPVILMCGPGELPLLPPAETAAVARALLQGCDVPVALHLDHGDSLEMVDDCLAAGFTSVMLDFSQRPLQENTAAMQRVVASARPLGVTVEGEIGVVGKVDDATVEGGDREALTDPEEAVEFVAATGVDALAVAIGNAHGQYTKLPRLDFGRLERLSAAVSVPLVLHGGTGTPPADLRRAISLGIAKVNVATELVSTVRASLTRQWDAKRNPWTPLAMAEAVAAMEPVVAKWIGLTGAAGRA